MMGRRISGSRWCAHSYIKRGSRTIETFSHRTNLKRTAEMRVNLEFLKIRTLTTSGIYSRPPPSASQIITVLGITLHTAAAKPM